MSTRTLVKSFPTPSMIEDFFKPWNEWFDNGGLLGKVMTMPAVNVSEDKNYYSVSLAAPGLQKEDFKINIEGKMLTISSEKEDKKEDKDERFTRKEYSYSSFSRSFTMPEDVNQDSIDARYENGVLHTRLPRKEEAKKIAASKKVFVK